MCLDPLDAMTLWAFKTWTITMYCTAKSDMFNVLIALSCVEDVARSCNNSMARILCQETYKTL